MSAGKAGNPPPRYGLVAAGSAARGILSELALLRSQLGPVASSSMKVAGRIANALKSGTATGDMQAFNQCRVVLACAPDTGMDRVIGLLDNPRLEWSGRVLLFCDSGVSSLDLPRFQECGAYVGSLNSIPAFPKSFVVEGHREAIREAKRLIKAYGGMAFEVESSAAHLFAAARTFSGGLFTPLIDSCVECIQQSGLDRKIALRLAEGLLQHSLRSYLHAGRRGWDLIPPEAIQRQYEALREVNELRAEYFRGSSEFAFRLYRSFPELARYLAKS